MCIIILVCFLVLIVGVFAIFSSSRRDQPPLLPVLEPTPCVVFVLSVGEVDHGVHGNRLVLVAVEIVI